MIIRRHDDSLLLITQPDHARLSGEIMEYWHDGGLATHPRRASILLAIREHDNGWEQVDSRPLVDPDTGALLDFMNAPDHVRRGIWPRAVERLAENPWAAALVAQHAIHIYRRYQADDAWRAFFGGLEALRAAHLRRSGGLELEDLLADYPFVRLGDLVSLTFCNGWSEAPEQPGYTIRSVDGRLSVAPDPFHGAEIPLAVNARELSQTVFQSAMQAATAFEKAPIRSLTGAIAGSA